MLRDHTGQRLGGSHGQGTNADAIAFGHTGRGGVDDDHTTRLNQGCGERKIASRYLESSSSSGGSRTRILDREGCCLAKVIALDQREAQLRRRCIDALVLSRSQTASDTIPSRLSVRHIDNGVKGLIGRNNRLTLESTR